MSLTGKDLLNTFSKLTEAELAQPVYVYADQGQSHCEVDSVLVGETATDLEYCLEDTYVHPDDRSEYEEADLKLFIEIS